MLRRKRVLKILAMVPPEDSGESSDEENIIQRVELPLPSEAIEEDLDELLRELEQNPLHEVNILIIMYFIIKYFYSF